MSADVEILDEVVTVIREISEDHDTPIGRETTAADVDGWDSVTNIEVLVVLEERFGVRFHTGEMASLKNVGELVDAIAARRTR